MPFPRPSTLPPSILSYNRLHLPQQSRGSSPTSIVLLPSTSGASPYPTTVPNQNLLACDAPTEWARLIFIDFLGNDLTSESIWAAMAVNLTGNVAPSLLAWLHAAAAGVIDPRPCAHFNDRNGFVLNCFA